MNVGGVNRRCEQARKIVGVITRRRTFRAEPLSLPPLEPPPLSLGDRQAIGRGEGMQTVATSLSLAVTCALPTAEFTRYRMLGTPATLVETFVIRTLRQRDRELGWVKPRLRAGVRGASFQCKQRRPGDVRWAVYWGGMWTGAAAGDLLVGRCPVLGSRWSVMDPRQGQRQTTYL